MKKEKVKEDRITEDDATRIDNPFFNLPKGDMTKFEGRETDFWKNQEEIIQTLRETNPGKHDIHWESLLINRFILLEILKKLKTVENIQENMNRIINTKEEMYKRGPNKLR